MRSLIAVLLLSGALVGADLTGSWTGAAEVKLPDGRVMTREFVLTLTHNASELTGSAGPAGRIEPIRNASLDGNRLTFETPVVNTDRAFAFEFTVNGEIMRGSVKGISHTGDPINVQLQLTRKAVAPAEPVRVSGTWFGTAELGSEPRPAVFVLSQAGAQVTGTAGGSPESQIPIRAGRLEGKRLLLEVQIPDGPLVQVDGLVEADKVEGKLHAVTPDGTKIEGKFSVTKKG